MTDEICSVAWDKGNDTTSIFCDCDIPAKDAALFQGNESDCELFDIGWWHGRWSLHRDIKPESKKKVYLEGYKAGREVACQKAN